MKTAACSHCGSHDIYHSSHHRRERIMKWLHPGRSLYHCHSCGRHFWLRRSDEVPTPPHELENHPSIITDLDETDHGNTIGLYCPSCGVPKTWMGIWWDDLWTSFRGHNKLYKCRSCDMVFSPPP